MDATLGTLKCLDIPVQSMTLEMGGEEGLAVLEVPTVLRLGVLATRQAVVVRYGLNLRISSWR